MSTAPEDMACRQFHGTIIPNPSRVFFFMLYDNAMTFNFDLNLSGPLVLKTWMLWVIGRLDWTVSVNQSRYMPNIPTAEDEGVDLEDDNNDGMMLWWIVVEMSVSFSSSSYKQPPFVPCIVTTKLKTRSGKSGHANPIRVQVNQRS